MCFTEAPRTPARRLDRYVGNLLIEQGLECSWPRTPKSKARPTLMLRTLGTELFSGCRSVL